MAAPEKHVSQDVELRERATKRVLAARVVPATAEHLSVHDLVWRPLLRAQKALDAEWEWHADFLVEELPSETYETYAVVIVGESLPQALISLRIEDSVIYVERFATAPENRGSGGRIRLAGTALLLHAIRRSSALGFFGTLYLHSLDDPETIGYYRDRIGMVEVGRDFVDGQQMRRFELKRDVAARLLGGTS